MENLRFDECMNFISFESFFCGVSPSKMLDSNHTPISTYINCVFPSFLGGCQKHVEIQTTCSDEACTLCFFSSVTGTSSGHDLLLMATRNPARKPVEVGSSSHLLQGFSTIQTVLVWGFPNHQQYHQNGKRHYLWCFKSTYCPPQTTNMTACMPNGT